MTGIEFFVITVIAMLGATWGLTFLIGID